MSCTNLSTTVVKELVNGIQVSMQATPLRNTLGLAKK